MKKFRHGKYHDYEREILQFLSKQKHDVSATQIRIKAKIPKSSCYDVLGRLRYYGYIEWIGEPQDAISMVMIASKGKEYLKQLQLNSK